MKLNGRIDSLDSLRGIAAMIVVIFHCLLSFNVFYYANYEDEYSNKFVELITISPLHTIWAGKEAVLLFFVLSGFVLALPFLNGNAPEYKVYVVRRFFRIYIPYVVLIFISGVLMIIFAEYKDIEYLSSTFNNRWDHYPTITSILAHILMINYDSANINGVVWSLYHEMRISLFFPLIVLLFIKFNWKKALGIALILTFIVYNGFTFVAHGFTNEMLAKLILSFRETFYYLVFFIMGTTLASRMNYVQSLIKPLNPGVKASLFVLSLLLVNDRWMYKIVNFKGSLIDDILPGIGILILFSLILSSEKIDKILTLKPFLFLGNVSYSLYLVHIPVLMLSVTYLSKVLPVEFAFLLVPVLSLPFAYFAYKYIEIPSNNLGKKIGNKISNKQKASYQQKQVA